jgi:hypothetical protein
MIGFVRVARLIAMALLDESEESSGGLEPKTLPDVLQGLVTRGSGPYCEPVKIEEPLRPAEAGAVWVTG